MHEGTWTDRLPRWLTASQRGGGPALGPRERWVLLLAFVGIAVWGFSGSWELPTKEIIRESSPRSPGPVAPLVAGPPAAVRGEALFQANGCYACHTLDGQRKIGPSLLGVYGATVELEDGTRLVIDEAYIVESILHPEAKRVAGYEGAAMPSYEGLVSPDDAGALADYIKSLR